MRRLAAGGVVAAVFIAAGSALAVRGADVNGQRPPEQNAFQRPATPTDALPRVAREPLTRRFGGIVESRRVATGRGFRGGAALYLVRLKRNYTCLILVSVRGAGGGCSRSREFLSAQRRVNAAATLGFFNGIVSSGIARVAVVSRDGQLRSIHLTRDGGFLYLCRNRNGCLAVIKAVNGYDSTGRLVSHQDWSQ